LRTQTREDKNRGGHFRGKNGASGPGRGHTKDANEASHEPPQTEAQLANEAYRREYTLLPNQQLFKLERYTETEQLA
jgi:hypothetical protein